MCLRVIEAELLQHAQAERRRWHHIAQLLMRVEGERLWQSQASSFTAWLQSVARRADLQESVFWRCLKAGRIYVEATGQGLPDDVEVSADALELADKISRHAPARIAGQVLQRTLDGQLSRTELRDVWSTYRPASGGATARGRLPEDSEAREAALAARKTEWEREGRKPENRADVRRAEIVAAFRTATWLDEYEQARPEVRLGLAKQMAAVLVVRRRADQPERLEFHGLWTCVSAPELEDFDFQAAAGIDYMWLGVPRELAQSAGAKVPRLAGILSLGRDRSLSVVRPAAQRRPLGADGRIAVLTALLQRAYMWP